jgi:hypothetical protein
MASRCKDNNYIANKMIYLPIDKCNSNKFIEDIDYAKSIIDKYIKEHKELFPKQIQQEGYIFHGKTSVSKKLGIRLRRIKIGQQVYQIESSHIMPYMTGYTDDIEKGLFLTKFHVPFWAIAWILGRNDSFWYRTYIQVGRNNIAGTTIKSKEKMPYDTLSDEEHIMIKGKKHFVATTVGAGCILGVETSESASEEDLTKSYAIFKHEMQTIDADYQPNTNNTDGWAATQNAWKALFPKVIIIQCFLHAYIKIRDRALKQFDQIFRQISKKVWDCYKSKNKQVFAQRIRRLSQWAEKNVPKSIMKDKLLDLCKKAKLWKVFYSHPSSHRTSNALDRLMKFMKRHQYMHQKYHGAIRKTTLNLRAYALIINFAPLNPYTVKKNEGMQSYAEKINGFKYHTNWLHNLLISSSLQSKYKVNNKI